MLRRNTTRIKCNFCDRNFYGRGGVPASRPPHTRQYRSRGPWHAGTPRQRPARPRQSAALTRYAPTQPSSGSFSKPHSRSNKPGAASP